jgi:hypothetical protein
LRLRSASSLLTTIRKYIGDNIQKRISLILEIWELATSSTTLSSRILNFKEYLQKDLDNDEHFYKEVVGTFSAKVSNMNDVHRREKNLPSKIRLRQINACWLKRIKCLREILVECDTINTKRSDVFLKLVDLTKELKGPHLIMDSILLSKDQLQEQLDALKISWESEFNDLTEYSEEEVEKWLIHYVNKNEDVEDTLHQLSFDFKDIENELFDARIKHETMVSPMRSTSNYG